MRRLATFALLICLLLSTSTAFALDLSYVEARPEQYTISVNESCGSAFISTALKPNQIFFSHKYESELYYSYMYSDILVKHHGTKDAEPVWRWWLEYYTESKYQNFKSVTFEFDGKSFTFNEVSTPNSLQMKESSYKEELCILLGRGTEAFITAFDEYVITHMENRPLNLSGASTVKMILHGDEDIVIKLPFGPLYGLLLMKYAYQETVGLTMLSETYTTPMIQNEEPLLAVSQYITITNSSANIRSGPDASYAKIKTAVKGDTFPLVGEDNGWYVIDVNGRIGYVSQKLCEIQ